MKYVFKILTIIVLVHLIISCGTQMKDNGNKEIVIFAGVGMKDVIIQLIDSFKIEYPEASVLTNFAASGVLARQIQLGEVPDVFIAANRKWMDFIDSLGLIIDHHQTIVAKNELVLIVPKNSSIDSLVFDGNLDLTGLIGNRYLSIGDPSFVPVGTYAKQSLMYYDFYDQLQGKLLLAKDVRSAMWVVEMGEAPLGIVFRSEAQKSQNVKQLAVVPSNTHKPIEFIMAKCRNSVMSSKFYDFLNSEKSRQIWVQNGFF